MLTPRTSTKFQKDIKKLQKRGRNLSKLKGVMSKLVDEIPLETKNKDHLLTGNYSGHRECHIEPDWLLIYKIEGEEVWFVRSGTHSDLF